MIFVTLGSQKFQFDRLLRKVDELIERDVIREPVIAQTGYSTYQPVYYASEKFMDRDRFSAVMDRADMVITHGGTGAIINGVKKGKTVIAVPRRKKYGEHVDDHQMQIVEQFDEMNLIQACMEVDQLDEAIRLAKHRTFERYQSNTERYLQDIDRYLHQIFPDKVLR